MAKPTVPVYNQDGAFTWWLLDQVYTGPNGTGIYVPNVGDGIIDWATGFYRVTSLDVSTYLAEWEKWTPPSSVDTSLDALFGTVPGYASESSRVYYDRSVTPHVLAIDKRLRMYGSETEYVMIFKGTDINKNTGKVIGFMVDSTGHIGTRKIPLELVAFDQVNNYSVKVPKLAYTSEALTDGEVVTVVAYSAGDAVVSYQKMLVKDTSFTASGATNTRYITGIRIDSPYLDTAKENWFRIPQYTSVESLSMQGFVDYSDGSSRAQTITLGIGGKMRLMGFESFVATIVGQKVPLVLTYYLDSTEETYGAQSANGTDRYISKLYTAEVTPVDGADAVKLFPIPTWANSQWKLDYWLYSLDRKNFYYVTPNVNLGQTSADFQPTLYGQRQGLTVTIDLSKVDSRFKPLRHSQTFDVTLLQDGLSPGNPWYLRYSPGQDPAYGQGISAKFKFGSVDNWGLKVDCGANNLTEWLEALYFRTQPLFYPDAETQGLTPTHFAVVIASDVQPEFPINRWDTELAVSSGGSEGEGIHIRWIYRDGNNNDLYLGASPMVVRHVTDYSDGTSIHA